MESGNLVCMTTKLVQADLGDQIPDDDVCVSTSTSESDARLVEDECSNSRSVTIEADDDCRRPRVPDPNGAIRISIASSALSS